jgi:iron complex outermembrane receptor protein
MKSPFSNKRSACGIAATQVCTAMICMTMTMTMTAIAQTTSPPVDLTQASLDDLMNIQVTSVAKKGQSLSKVAGSIYVITQDDIRHSGMTSVPELLRMVPGVEVARLTANTWAISIRGFNYRYSGKVLVLIDGRSVYTSLFSGVYWDQQTMPLENIDRIEVIRGPGGTVWGANAMNGVINVITKSANDTKGGLVSVEAGSQISGQGLAQYGGTAGANGSYRVYGRYTMNQDSPSLPGNPAVDDAHSSQVGFRSDWNLTPRDKLTVQGDMLGASEGQTLTTLFSNRLPNYYTINDHVQLAAGNILGRWNHLFTNGSETTVQVYYDRYRRFDQGLNVQGTADFDFQYHFRVGERNDIVVGTGYRSTDQSFANGYLASFGTGHRRDNLFSGFVQDEVRLTKTVSLTMGSKFEHNSYTGYENEPSVQIAWSPTSRQTAWASVSRAIQQPYWLFADGQADAAAVAIPGLGPAIYHLTGNTNGEASRVIDFELGYRAELSKRMTVDTTVFTGDYNDLETLSPQTPYFTLNPAPAHLVLPNVFGNLGKAKTYGIEASAHWDVTKWWRISPGYTFLQMHVSQDVPGNSSNFAATPGDSPKHQAQLRSTMKLPHHVDWDTSVYYVGALASGIGTLPYGPVPSYTRLDVRFGRHLGEFAEISIAGQNLLGPRRIEFLDGFEVNPTETARAITLTITRHF